MIPIYVNVFNRLTMTRTLCAQLANLPNADVVIIDNNSTWIPLLDWYSNECPHEVIRLRENLGKHAPWLSGVVGSNPADVYGVTDCDLDLTGVPLDLLDVLSQPLDTYTKVGIGLRIHDLPDWQSEVVKWESQFWQRPVTVLDRLYFRSLIDTTLCLYRRDTPDKTAMTVVGIPTLRSGGDYIARHAPWYLDCLNLDEENANYFTTASGTATWKPKGQALSAGYSGKPVRFR